MARKYLLLALCWLLASCAHDPPAAPTPKSQPARDPVAAIRAVGANHDSVIEVLPVRDPAVTDLVERARVLEAEANYAAAADKIEYALKIAPGAPELLQYLAELCVRRGQLPRAEALALQSFERGPRVGSLCARNWQTVVEARDAQGNSAGAKAAQIELGSCRLAPPLRM